MAQGTIYQKPRVEAKPHETVVTSTCGHNCGGRCVVNAHVVDGRIARISSDPARWNSELPPLQACARGFGQIERVYHPDRLQYPLRRTGPRGSGQFERISWDEALDEVAREMLRVRAQYGNAAILDASRSGSLSALHGRTAAQRFLYMFGGCTELWSNMSAEAEVFAVRMTYGAKAVYKSAGREPTDYVNSKLILMWGWSPGDGTFGTGTWQYLRQAKKQGVRIVCVDPRRTRSSSVLADEHVFIQPSTDTAALIAMAYVIASEGLHDQAYCDAHVLGFDEDHLPPGAPAGASYLSYLNGVPDGIKKTPEWAAEITGIPAETIRRLAIEFATTKPAALQCGYAPGRTAYGEQFHRAAYALAAMTGNVGIKGGSSGVSNGATGRAGIKTLPAGDNPIDARVASPLLADLLARGKSGGYPADIKLIYSMGGDLFNQAPNVNKMVRVARRRGAAGGAGPLPHAHRAVCRHRAAGDHLLGAQRRAHALGRRRALRHLHEAGDRADGRVPQRHGHLRRPRRAGSASRATTTRPRSAWLRELTGDAVDDFDAFAENGVARFAAPRGRGRFRARDPRSRAPQVHHALGQDRDLFDGDGRQPRPVRSRPHAGDPHLGAAVPGELALSAQAVHAEIPGANALDPQQPARARPRRPRRHLAASGGRASPRHRRRRSGARVQRARHRRLPAHVTDRMAQGAVSIKEGAWFTPNAEGADTRGCANVLTDDRSAPCGATTYNTNQVDVAALGKTER